MCFINYNLRKHSVSNIAPTLNEVIDELKVIRLEMKFHANKKGLEDLKGLITSQAKTISNLQEKVGNLEEELKILKADADERDQYSRRTSLRFNGIEKTDGKTAEKCRQEVIKVIKKLKLPIPEDPVDIAHRVGVPAKSKG